MFDFPVEVDDLDTVPSEFQNLYDQGEDGFVLNSALSDKFADIPLAYEMESLKDQNSSLILELEAFRGLAENPQELVGKMTDLERNVEATLSNLAEKEQEIGALLNRNDAFEIEAVATKAIAAARGSVPLLLPHIRSAVGFVENAGVRALQVLGTDGAPRQNEAGQNVTVTDLIEEMKLSPIFGRAFDGDSISGGGMNPSGSGSSPTVSLKDPSAINARIEDIAAGKVSVSL